MLIEAVGDYPSTWSTVQTIASKIDCTLETLWSWYKKHIEQIIPALVQAQNFVTKELERENRELKQISETIRTAATFFTQAETGCPLKW